jgi:WD40 repeat protein
MRWRARLAALLAVVLAAPAGGQAQGLKLRATLEGPTRMLRCVAFSPDGKTLGAAGLPVGEPSAPVAGINLWDVATGKERLRLRGPAADVGALAFSPDGRTLAATNSDGTVRLWDAATGQEGASFKGLGEYGGRPAFSPDGKALAAAGARVCVWEVTTRKERRSFGGPRQELESLALSPDLKTLAAAYHQDVDLWDVATGKLRLTLPDHRGRVACAAFSPDGKVVAVACNRDEGGLLKHTTEVKLWDAATGKERATFPRHEGYVWEVRFSPDGKALALLEARNFTPRGLKVLDAATGRTLATLSVSDPKEDAYHMAFSPDGKLLATACAEGKVRLWDVLPGRGP